MIWKYLINQEAVGIDQSSPCWSRFYSSSNQRRVQAAAALLPRRDWLPPPDPVQRLGGRRPQTHRWLWVGSRCGPASSPSPGTCFFFLFFTRSSLLSSPPGWMKVFAMKHGVVGIRGVKSGLYLCLSGAGLAHGEVSLEVHGPERNQDRTGTEPRHTWPWKCLLQKQFSDDCLLKEHLEENHYTTYSSLLHPDVYLALSHKGGLRRGNNVGRHQSCTHFLPRKTPWPGAAKTQGFKKTRSLTLRANVC